MFSGSIPQINRAPEGAGIKRLFHTRREVSLIIDKTLQGGYGYLDAGTVMMINMSDAGGKGKLIPYVPVYGSLTLGQKSALGVAALVQDAASGTIKVSIDDSYAFEVGDDLYLENSSGEGPVKAAAITAIDRTDSRWAAITTTAFSHGNFTVAKSAYCYVQGSESDPYAAAAYVLDQAVDTGYGVGCLGALASVVVSNAVLYKNSLINMTTEAISSLSAVSDGQFIILK